MGLRKGFLAITLVATCGLLSCVTVGGGAVFPGAQGHRQVFTVPYKDVFLGCLYACMKDGFWYFQAVPDFRTGRIANHVASGFKEAPQMSGNNLIQLTRLPEDKVEVHLTGATAVVGKIGAYGNWEHELAYFAGEFFNHVEQYLKTQPRPRFDIRTHAMEDAPLKFIRLWVDLEDIGAAAGAFNFGCAQAYQKERWPVAFDALVKEGKESVAIQICDAVTDSSFADPSAAALAEAGAFYAKQAKWEDAEKSLRRAVEKEPKSFMVQQRLADFWESNYHYEKALPAWQEVVNGLPAAHADMKTRKGNLYKSLGVYLMNQGWIAEGAEALRHAIERYGNTSAAGQDYYRFTMKKTAVYGATLRFMKADKKGEVVALMRGGPAYLAGVRIGDIVSGMELSCVDGTWIEFAGEQPYESSWTLSVERGGQKLDLTLQGVLDGGRVKAEELNKEGSRLAKEGENQNALDVFREALGFDPFLAKTHYNIGLLADQAGQVEEAYLAYLAYLAMDPEAADAQEVKAHVQELEGGLPRKPSETVPEKAEELFLQGNARAKNQNYGGAVVSYVSALDVCPGYLAAHRNLGAVLKALELTDSALRAFGRYLAAAPADSADVSNVKGQIAELKEKANR